MGAHYITSIHKGGMEFATELNNHTVTIDLFPDDGGNNKGPQPKALMLVSLAGCTGVDVVMILHKMKVVFSDLIIDVEGQLTDTIPKTYQTVKLTYKINVKKGDEDKVKKAVDLSQDKYCGVSAMFRAFAKLETEIIYSSLSE